MFAVIFSSQQAPVSQSGDGPSYAETADRMVELAQNQPGFLSIESARNADGSGITVSYWETEADIAAWKANAEHLIAQERGRTEWYSSYRTRVAKVTREYSR